MYYFYIIINSTLHLFYFCDGHAYNGTTRESTERMDLLGSCNSFNYVKKHTLLTKSCRISLKSFPYFSSASSKRFASEADHSSISSRQRTGPVEGTSELIASAILYECLWRVSIAWNYKYKIHNLSLLNYQYKKKFSWIKTTYFCSMVNKTYTT